jgi:diacylglycerol kinase family enzyme
MARLDQRKNIDLAHQAAEKKMASVLELMNAGLGGCPAYPVKISLDQRDLSGQYVLVEAMHIPSVGPNLCLAPAADPGDGVLALVLVADRERIRLSRCLRDHLEGRSDRALLTVHRGRRLRIECECPPIHIDDELKSKNEAGASPPSSVIDVTIESRALEMLVPA